jgi:hypothetical protein
MHAGGIIQFVLCDGSVSAVNEFIDMNVFVAACTIQGEEIRSLGSEN